MRPTMTDALLVASEVHKSFGGTEVLHGVDLRVAPGEFVAVMGPSGSGKSTLLNSIAGLDTVDAGRIRFDGTELTTLAADALADVRRTRMGFVFQQPTLLRDLTLLDNIVLTSALGGVGTAADRVARAESLLARAGIGGLGGRFPSQVSGGQLQRAGICRALMREPRILFGDEPTGALNSRAADEVMDLLGELNAEGTALLVVTHDANVAARADRVVFMKDGRIADEVQLDGTDLVAAINTSMQELAI
ncbi:ABC transporter ATP-binding protein [Microlunatus sp. Y2014]|uniref:ABC transporter ATP-binding protein n=1 Tax=Microlunatus sp. Y2014 TaxID=3418488 RepID=UPI003DA7006B